MPIYMPRRVSTRLRIHLRKTSQGGGCWVEGTPVTVIDGDHIYDIPVEDLEPGMMMPWYDPVTDTLRESACLSNQRTYTHTIYVAAVEGGYTLEMTGEQPMDVLRPHYATGEIVWHKIPARYIGRETSWLGRLTEHCMKCCL